jgi:hypothetical protein
MAKVLLKQPDFVKRGAVFELVKEDMEVMTDSELQVFCDQYKVILHDGFIFFGQACSFELLRLRRSSL